jgi:predicted PurR-regulated permease PerM
MTKEYPFYLKSTVVLFGLVLLAYILYGLGDIIVPFAFATLLTILLNPLCNRFIRLKIPKPLAILITLLIAILTFSLIFFFLSSQVSQFGHSLPIFKERMGQIIDQIEQWINNRFGIASARQAQFIKDAMNGNTSIVGRTFGNVLRTVSFIIVIPVYVFMMLFYKTLILSFLYEVFSEKNSDRVSEILRETKAAIQSYIIGLLIEMVLVGSLNSTALLLLGVKYAILLGFLGAVINMLPLIGGIISITLPILVATVTKDGFSTQIAIIISYMLIQFIDNNLIFPRFVSIKVKVNALISIVVVLLGNALWGISGMFLSLPFTAVIKIIFDRIDDLKPWGKLLGHEVPVRHIGEIWRLRRRRKKAEAEVKLTTL